MRSSDTNLGKRSELVASLRDVITRLDGEIVGRWVIMVSVACC